MRSSAVLFCLSSTDKRVSSYSSTDITPPSEKTQWRSHSSTIDGFCLPNALKKMRHGIKAVGN
jgi:hypothetical protein